MTSTCQRHATKGCTEFEKLERDLIRTSQMQGQQFIWNPFHSTAALMKASGIPYPPVPPVRYSSSPGYGGAILDRFKMPGGSDTYDEIHCFAPDGYLRSLKVPPGRLTEDEYNEIEKYLFTIIGIEDDPFGSGRKRIYDPIERCGALMDNAGVPWDPASNTLSIQAAKEAAMTPMERDKDDAKIRHQVFNTVFLHEIGFSGIAAVLTADAKQARAEFVQAAVDNVLESPDPGKGHKRLKSYEKAGIAYHKNTRVTLAIRLPFGCWTCGVTHMLRFPTDARADPLPPGYYEVIGLTSEKAKQHNGKIGWCGTGSCDETYRHSRFVDWDDKVQLNLQGEEKSLFVKRKNLISVIDKKTKICRGCRKARYCSYECLERGWNELEHSKMCSSLVKLACLSKKGLKSRFSGSPEPEQDGGVVGLKHPCLNCNVREEDAANGFSGGGICYACGQVYCGHCMDPEPHMTKCKGCGLHFGASKHEKVERLQKLLAEKPAGRHFKHAATAMCIAYAFGEGGLEQDFKTAREWIGKAGAINPYTVPRTSETPPIEEKDFLGSSVTAFLSYFLLEDVYELMYFHPALRVPEFIRKHLVVSPKDPLSTPERDQIRKMSEEAGLKTYPSFTLYTATDKSIPWAERMKLLLKVRGIAL